MSSTSSFPDLMVDIGGVRLLALADQFDTPLYVYDAASIERRVAELSMFDVTRYAQKACSNLAIIDLIRQRGCLVDTVSAGEIGRALAAGYLPGGDPPSIVYTADIFDRPSLDLVSQHGIHVNCGSPDMIDQYGARAPGESITLRINPGFGHGHSRKTNTGGEQSKHGIWHEQLGEMVTRAGRYGLRVEGLHMHIGSGTDMEHLGRVCAAMEETARAVGDGLRSISAGGGLPVPYRSGEPPIDLPSYYATWDATRRRLEADFGHAVRLEIEPGRYLVAESGYLITEIRAIKQMGENTFYLVDAGFNNLARPVLYGAYHPMAIGVAPDEPSGVRSVRQVVVGGPLCESGDIFTQQEGGFVAPRELPAAEVGDRLVIQCAGAYGFGMSSNYCSKPFCAEVLVRDGQAHLIRHRQELDDLMRDEQIPGK